jgi:Tol biopolymer transport system component
MLWLGLRMDSRWCNGSLTHIYTYNVALGTTLRQLTFDGQNAFPVFSSDGNRVEFRSLRDGTDGLDLFVKTLDDDEPARSIITLPSGQVPVQWLSDGLIVFEQRLSPNAPSGLRMIDLSNPDSAVAVEYLSAEADLGSVVVSPDGSIAAYTSDESGRMEVYIRSFPEAGGRTLVSQSGGEFPRWSPAGNTVYYWSLGVSVADTFFAARIRRNPTPVVLSRDSLFTAGYY